MDEILDILFAPVKGLTQGVVANIWPTDDPAVRRMQSWTAVSMLSGAGFLIAGIAAIWFAASWKVWLALFAAGWIFFAIADFVGERVEKECLRQREEKRKQKQAPNH